MSVLAIIGGSGIYQLDFLGSGQAESVHSHYQAAPVTLMRYSTEHGPVLFLPRHGAQHQIPPHKINYRANIHTLKLAGADTVIAVNAVGGIDPGLSPGSLCIPDQIIDYTWGRDHTYFEGGESGVQHVDFTHPYTEATRHLLLRAARQVNDAQGSRRRIMEGGTYGATQGPRLETAAEIRRLQQDGCALVGMTGMPEAALAREADLAYAAIALSVNWAAGLDDAPLELEAMMAVLKDGADFLQAVLAACCADLGRNSL